MAKKNKNVVAKKPAKNVPKKVRSKIVKKARKGQNVFGGGFQKVASKAAKEYGSVEAGRRVAASVMWKKVAKNVKKGKK